MNEWINFKDLRANLDFEKVLHRYGIEIKRKGNQHHGFCPLRVVDDSLVSEDNPRYRFPSKRERDGKIFEFRKTLFLYNGHSLPSGSFRWGR